MTLTACDVSTYQVPVNDSYPHRWLIFRVCDGDYPDSKAPANLRWAVAARKSGRLDGFTVYCVYRPGENAAILDHLNTFNVPTDCTVMVDVESWNGQIKGNRSTEITALVTALAKRQGSQSRVWCYGDRGDLTSLYPTRPKWLGLVVASYGGSKPTNPGPGPLVGWQYTNGQYTVAGLPSSTNPFGACDHNQLYITPEDDDMPLTPADITAIGNEVVNRTLIGRDGKPHYVSSLMATEFSRFFASADAKGVLHDHALITWLNQANAPLLAQLNTLTAQVTALKTELEAVKSAAVTVTPTDVPAILHIGGTK